MSSGDSPDQKGSQPPAEETPPTKSHEAAQQPPIPEVDVLHTLVDEYKARDDQNARMQRRNFWLGVVTAVIIFIYTTVTALLWWETKRAATATTIAAYAARDSAVIAKQALLPKITVWKITPASAILPDAEIFFDFDWRNTGGGDALGIHMQANAGICVGKREINCLKIEPFSAPSARESRGQGDVEAKTGGFSSVRLPPQSEDIVRALWHGEQTIYLYGVFDYDDIFESSHRCEFCYFYMLDKGGTPLRCPTHNRCEQS
jgi:hypothetical protein